MDINEKRAEGYLEEAELSLDSAKAIFDEAQRTEKKLWAHVVKASYDSMEQAISAALAIKDVMIPKDHPEKVSEFITNYNIQGKAADILLSWLRKRGKSQYVDVRGGKVSIPHEVFTEIDAEAIIIDCEFIIKYVKELIRI